MSIVLIVDDEEAVTQPPAYLPERAGFGATLVSELLSRNWVAATQQHRGLTVTAEGRSGLTAELGVEIPAANRAVG